MRNLQLSSLKNRRKSLCGSLLVPAGVLLVLATACKPDTADHAIIRIDTLPGGIVRVYSLNPALWQETGTWQLIEDLVIRGKTGGDAELTVPIGVTRDSKGSIYVAQRSPASVKVFSRRGSYLRTVGREGEGPGEYRVPYIAIVRDTLIVHDPQLGRTTVFDQTGQVLRTWLSACCYWRAIAVDGEGQVYIPVSSHKSGGEELGFIRYRLNGAVVDTLLLNGRQRKEWTASKNGTTYRVFVPYSPSLVVAVNPRGGILQGWSGAYEIHASTNGQDTVSIFGRAWEPAPIPHSQREDALERAVRGNPAIAALASLSNVPETAPAFEGFVVDQLGYTWVKTYNGSDTTISHFDVFDSTGIFLGEVHGPRRLSTTGYWGANEVLVASEDQEGEPVVVRYQIVRQ